MCKHAGINNLQENRTDGQRMYALGPHLIWSKKMPITMCSHKLIIISELNVIPAIRWRGKIVLASTHNFSGGIDLSNVPVGWTIDEYLFDVSLHHDLQYNRDHCTSSCDEKISKSTESFPVDCRVDRRPN